MGSGVEGLGIWLRAFGDKANLRAFRLLGFLGFLGFLGEAQGFESRLDVRIVLGFWGFGFWV